MTRDQVFHEAQRLKTQGKYQEGLDLIEEHIDPEIPDSSMSFLLGELFDGVGDHLTAKDCYQGAYLSSLAF